MKAIHIPEFIPDPSALQPSTVPNPQPQAHEYLVRITHCSPQHVDLLHAQGRHQNNSARGWCHPPFVLGFDFAGVVVTLPSPSPSSSSPSASSPRLQPGDRVFGAAIGAFAELIAVPGPAIRRVPDGVSNATACALSGGAVGYAAVVHVAAVARGETVLVSGASGGLGSACCGIARALGARVAALTADEGKAGLMRRRMDVDHVVVMKGEGWVRDVLELTDGRGVDVVLDHTGMVNDAIRCLAYGGRIVVLGFAARNGVMEQVKVNRLLLKSATIVGYRFGESGRRDPQTLERIWDGYLEMIQSGRLEPFIYGSYNGLGDIGRALGDLAQRRVCGKIVVTVAEDIESAKL